MIMRDSLAKTTYLKDYEPPNFASKKQALALIFMKTKHLLLHMSNFSETRIFLKIRPIRCYLTDKI